MALSNPFVWGRGGAQLTPDQIAKQREIEDALLQRGIDTSPVGDWTQGLARVADAAAGSFRRGRLVRAEKENEAYNADKLKTITSLLGGVPSSSASIPAPAAAGEMGATSPSPAAAPVFANDGTELGSYLSDPNRRATLPAGMRNNNPGNIKFVGQRVPGIVGPSENTDQGDPQAVFDTPESGMSAMYSLLSKKYADGKLTPNQMIAGDMGWTPGNYQAAANVAKNAGIGPDDDIGLTDPAKASRFMRALILQEHGNRGALYPESMIASVVGGQPTQVASAAPQTATDAINAIAPQQPSAETAYADPQVTADFRAASGIAPPLPPPSTIASPPAVASFPPVQTAQAVPPQIMAPNGQAIPPAIIEALSDPRLNEQTRGIAELLLRQQQARQNAIMEQQIKQSDPGYQADLKLKQLQADQIANPRIGPADQARIDLDRDKQKQDQENRNTLTAAEQSRLDLDRQKFELEAKQGQWQKMTDGRLYNQTTGEFRDAPPPVPGSVPPKFEDVSGLRKEIQQLPSYKNLSQALPIYRSMTETAGRNSKASDLNLVYGLGKIMDPTSVVREGEMVMVKNTSSLPDWFQGAIASLNGGAALTPETRQAIMTEAFGRVQGYDQAFKQDTSQYGGIVQRNQFNPADVIPDFGTYEPWKAASAGGADIPPAPPGINAEDWKYLSPDQRRLWQK